MTSRKEMGMFEYVRVGEIERISQVEMSDNTKTVLMEMLAQNKMIVETNCSTIQLLRQPMTMSDITKDIRKKQKGE